MFRLKNEVQDHAVYHYHLHLFCSQILTSYHTSMPLPSEQLFLENRLDMVLYDHFGLV